MNIGAYLRLIDLHRHLCGHIRLGTMTYPTGNEANYPALLFKEHFVCDRAEVRVLACVPNMKRLPPELV